jgi:hypothetical protein
MAPSYMNPNAGEGGSCGVLANEYSCAHGAQINFGDLIPNLTYVRYQTKSSKQCCGTVMIYCGCGSDFRKVWVWVWV